MSLSELRDLVRRVGQLERQTERVDAYDGRHESISVSVKNVSGGDLALGDGVSISGTDATAGVLDVTKPDADSDMQFLGLVKGRILAGGIGRVQVTGLAIGRRDTTAMNGAAPVTGAHIGPQKDSHLLAHDQFGARFVADLYDAAGNVKMCLVLLQRTERLVADHRSTFTPGSGTTGHLESTPVYEPVDILGNTSWVNGLLSDLMSVVPVQRGRDSTYTVAHDIRRDAAHNHGWVKGFVIEQGGTGQDIGWGPWALVVGLRTPGQTQLDVNAELAHHNTGVNTYPIGFNDAAVAVDKGGDLVYGWMVPDAASGLWRPAVPVDYELRSIDLAPGYDLGDCGEADHCRLLVNPTRYHKRGKITGPHDSSTSLCNYLEWIACNRWDINGIFDCLWYVSCCFSWKVGEIDSNLKSILSSGQALDLWMQQVLTWGAAVQAWGVAVHAVFVAIVAIHPGLAGVVATEGTALTGAATQLAALNTQYAAHVWYDTDHCGKGPCGTEGKDLTYLLDCPYWGMQA